MSEQAWYCEHCSERQTGEPAHSERHDGHRETVEIRFCSECVE